MKRIALLILLFAVSASAQDLVQLSTQARAVPNRIGNCCNPSWTENGPLLRATGWRLVPTIPAVSNGFSRSMIVYYEGDGTNAVAAYSDTDIAAAAAQAAANAITNAIIAAVSWTNTFTNTWLQPHHVTAAHNFKVLGAKYLPGWPTNTTWTYNSAMAAFMSMPTGSQTTAQLWDNVFWQRSYVGISDMLPVYFPSTNAADPTDYNLKAYPELKLWDMPGVK